VLAIRAVNYLLTFVDASIHTSLGHFGQVVNDLGILNTTLRSYYKSLVVLTVDLVILVVVLVFLDANLQFSDYKLEFLNLNLELSGYILSLEL